MRRRRANRSSKQFKKYFLRPRHRSRQAATQEITMARSRTDEARQTIPIRDNARPLQERGRTQLMLHHRLLLKRSRVRSVWMNTCGGINVPRRRARRASGRLEQKPHWTNDEDDTRALLVSRVRVRELQSTPRCVHLQGWRGRVALDHLRQSMPVRCVINYSNTNREHFMFLRLTRQEVWPRIASRGRRVRS